MVEIRALTVSYFPQSVRQYVQLEGIRPIGGVYNTIKSSCNPYIGDEGASQTEASDDCRLLIPRLTCILFMYFCNSMSHFISHFVHDETKRTEEEALFRLCSYIPNFLKIKRNQVCNTLL
jgi:hypothetical protein